jgi:integrase
MRRGKIKPYTLHRDRRSYDLHLGPEFGRVGFTELDEVQISDWIDGQLDEGVAPKSIRNRHGLLFSILKHGQQRMKLRPDNPCVGSDLPELTTATSQARQVRFFQHGEWALFRQCVRSDVHLLLDLELATGIRWGEISALRIEDVSFAGEGAQRQANLHIVRAWSQRSPDDSAAIRWDEGENASWVLGPPKNGRARWVVVPGDVAARLEQAIGGQPERTYVFRTRHGNPWRYPDFSTDRWAPARRLAARHGLTRALTPHMLRHTCVVWSLAEGVKIEVVSEMIGHSSLQITYDIYGGLINLRDPVMAQAMARAMLISRTAVLPQVAATEALRPMRPGRREQSRSRRAS